MLVTIYKGFNAEFLERLTYNPLIDTSIDDKLDIKKFTNDYKKRLKIALITIENDAWITYQEFLAFEKTLIAGYEDQDYDLKIIRNNILFDYFPLTNCSDTSEVFRLLNYSDDESLKHSEESIYCNYYNDFFDIDGIVYGHLNEPAHSKVIITEDYYPVGTSEHLLPSQYIEVENEQILYINEDIEKYLKFISRNTNKEKASIRYQCSNNAVALKLRNSFLSWCELYQIKAFEVDEQPDVEIPAFDDLKKIAVNTLRIPGFTEFRELTFYKFPELNNETVKITQGQIISQIIEQSETAFENDESYPSRDIFITAPTGSGKSLMFQIPAAYIAEKYNKLTLIIEPIKALMQDQKEQLIKRGYYRVEAFNSDLISQTEKEKVLKRIKSGDVDLLYVSPETLLSYSIETLIGDREIGLIIIDEAHIVTTWGMEFRPDYWYLGKFIKQIRSGKYSKGNSQKNLINCIVCAFTATAVNGGPDDTVGDIISSLYMENPIKYIGYVKREDIGFLIHKHDYLEKGEKYEEKKAEVFGERIKKIQQDKDKTIVYFPFKSTLLAAFKGNSPFDHIELNAKNIGTYAGSISGTKETDKLIKDTSFNNFRSGVTPIMFATKAFGMGVDIGDIDKVYHFAPTGGLSDYVQEIGRAARDKNLNGIAETDYFEQDLNYMSRLRYMSHIKDYQLHQVLSGLYDVYKSNGSRRNFLISPESFTYIFNDKKDNEQLSINKLKIALMMLEKDLFDKNNYKVLTTKPKSIFTTAFVLVKYQTEEKLIKSKYGRFFRKISRGRKNFILESNAVVNDMGDIFEVDLKGLWEDYYPNYSFPQFKYHFFNKTYDTFGKQNRNKKYKILPDFLDSIFQRQKIEVAAKTDIPLKNVVNSLIDDFSYIDNIIADNFRNQYFTKKQLVGFLKDKYGKENSELVVSSIFALLDPESDKRLIKSRLASNKFDVEYIVPEGCITRILGYSLSSSKVKSMLVYSDGDKVSNFISLSNEHDTKLLKLLSLFGYISYNVYGGTEPQIFIRFNSPDKIYQIISGSNPYFNSYPKKIRDRNNRDIKILKEFFENDYSDKKRWDIIEAYFLGEDLLAD